MIPEERLSDQDFPLFYRVIGNGSPVVLVHGFGEDGTIWENQIMYLSKKYRLIIPDIPGSGQSPMNQKNVSMDDFAEDLKAILDHEDIDRCTMIGHSMGGYITLAFAEKYNESLVSFGLFHSSAFADNAEKIATRRKNIGFIREHGASRFLQQSIPNLFSEEFKEKYPEVVSQIIQRFANFSAESLVQYTEAMINRPNRTHILKNFLKPVLFIIGEHDNAVPLQQSLEQCHLPELSYIHICKHSGHMGMLEEANFCNKAIEKFLDN